MYDYVIGRIKELKIKWKNFVLIVEKENNYFSSDIKCIFFMYCWVFVKRGVFLKNGVFFEKWLMLFKNDEWGWSFIVIVGDKSYNLILNNVEIKDGLECFDFK